MNARVSGTFSGVGVGDSVTKIEIAWRLGAETAAAAMAAGRGIELTAAGDISDFIGAGYYLTTSAVAANTEYTPAVRITENMAGGGSQVGAWTNGTVFSSTPQWWSFELDGTALPGSISPAMTLMSPSPHTSTGQTELVGDGTLTLTIPAMSIVNRTNTDNSGVYHWQTGAIGANNIGNEIEIRFKINVVSDYNFYVVILDQTKMLYLRIGKGNGGTTLKLEIPPVSAWALYATLNLDQYYVLRVAMKAAQAIVTLDGNTIWSGAPRADTGYNMMFMGFETDKATGSTYDIPTTTVTIDYARFKTDGCTLL